MEKLTGKTYFRQNELARRWNCSPATIINYRKNGLLPYFQLPGSSNVLYPCDKIFEIEQVNTKEMNRKGGDKKKLAEIKKVEPCVSSPKKEWRI